MGDFERAPEARREAERRLRDGQPAPAASPKQLPLEAVKEDRPLFYVRDPLEVHKRAHIAALAKTPKDGRPLSPVLVWHGGDGWYCLDGHLRLEAYRQAKWGKEIPVEVCAGSLITAIGAAHMRNSRIKLNMTSPERNQAAWRFVCLVREGEVGAGRIADCSGVSERQVWNMRRVKRNLLAKDPGRELFSEPWQECRAEDAGEDQKEPPDYDAVTEAMAKEIADRVVKACGRQLLKNHEAVAMALEWIDARLPAFVVEHYGGLVPEDDPDEATEEDPDF